VTDNGIIALSGARPGWVDGLKPTGIMLVSDWSDQNRVLNQRSAAEPGKWRTSRTPYLKQIMDDLSNHSFIQRVTLMKGAQVGGTELGNNWIGYVIDHAPSGTLIVQPTVDLAKVWSRQRLAPMIEDMQCLKEKIKDSRSRDSGNTVLLKEYDGGILRIAGANSAAGLRSMPVKYLMLDEVDAYPHDVDGEGDPVELAINRTKTFSRKKILEISTPTTKGLSRVERSFNAGTQSYYFVPCPHCLEAQALEFKNIKWSKDDAGDALPETAALACIHCGALIDESKKTWMLDNGEWRDTQKNKKHKSYHLSSLYSPLGWESWAEIVVKFLAAKDSEELLKTFTNTIEGLPFEERGREVSEHALMQRAEDYPLKICPIGCLALTAGVDIQDNRIEILVWGHGARERWIIDRAVIYGSPGDVETWKSLDQYLLAPFEHQSGAELSISATAIDSGGHFTQQVYDFCRLRKSRHIIAVKGSSVKNKPILGKPSKVDVTLKGLALKNGAEVWMVGTDTAKSLIYSLLEIEEPAADGFIHFSDQLSEDFYKQLTSEKLARRYVKGFPVNEWVKPPGARNEMLDCSVYAFAAFWLLGLHRWRSSQWRQLEERIQPASMDLFAQPEPVELVEPESAQIESPQHRKKRKSRRRASLGERLTNV
jgi:phage terminase large subunit GpA-like protein